MSREISVTISADFGPFRRALRSIVIIAYKSTLGWKRFLVKDYWKVLFSRP